MLGPELRKGDDRGMSFTGATAAAPAVGRPVTRRELPSPLLEANAFDGNAVAPHATWAGSGVFLVCLFLTATSLPDGMPSEIARYAAIGVGIGLAASVAFDLVLGWRNLIRADLMALASLYFLVFFEFLFDQEKFNSMILSSSLHAGIISSIWGFAGMILGRHLLGGKKPIELELFQRQISPNMLMFLLLVCFGVGFLNVFLTVKFDILYAIDRMMAPRFSQPWGRGRFGNWSALLYELRLLIYLVPGIAGIVYAKLGGYQKWQVVFVTVCFGFTLFFAFTSGTRNMLASFLATFIIAYGFSLPRQQYKRLMVVAGAVLMVLLISTTMMLEFRNAGFKNWYLGHYVAPAALQDEFFVDHNLLVISSLTQVFPSIHGYLGWEIPYNALVRPIPRAIWPGKPEGLSMGIEESLGAEGLTLASSFIGEAYMCGGNVVVVLTGLLFGALTGWWSRLANPRNSDFGSLVYASGFFATVITMRSLFVLTTAILPTIGAAVLGYILLKKRQEQRLRPGQSQTTKAASESNT